MSDLFVERRQNVKFCRHHFLINITSRKFIIWVATTVLFWISVFKSVDQGILQILAVVWGAVSLMYFIGDCIIEAIVKAVGNASINIGKK